MVLRAPTARAVRALAIWAPNEKIFMRCATVVGGLLLASLAVGCGPPLQGQLERNKDLVRRFAAKIDAEEWDALETLVADDVQRHSRATLEFPEIDSREAFIEYEKGLHGPFPDGRVTYEMMLAEGDMVAAYATFTGTNSGPLGERPPTGKSVEVKFIAMFRIEEGRIAEIWVEWDNLSRLAQLGLSPGSTSEVVD